MQWPAKGEVHNCWKSLKSDLMSHDFWVICMYKLYSVYQGMALFPSKLGNYPLQTQSGSEVNSPFYFCCITQNSNVNAIWKRVGCTWPENKYINKVFGDKIAPSNFSWTHLNWQKDFAALQRPLSDGCDACGLTARALPLELPPCGVTAVCDTPAIRRIQEQSDVKPLWCCFPSDSLPACNIQLTVIAREAQLCAHLNVCVFLALTSFSPQAALITVSTRVHVLK